MLVLSRKPDQEVIIAGCVQVRVLSIDGGRVRLGITAPRTMAVHRSEVASAIAHAEPAEELKTCWWEREVDHECAPSH